MRTRQNTAVDTSSADATSLGTIVGLIDKTLRKYGCDPTPLFATTGIDLNDARDANARIPTVKVQRLWRLSVEVTGDPGFGLTAAEQFQPAVLHGLGFAWLASDTLRDGLARLCRFCRLIHPTLRSSLVERGETVDLVMTGPERWPCFVWAAADAGMAIFLRMCQITVGDSILPMRVSLQRPPPDCAERFEAFFGAPVEYQSPDNRLCFDRGCIDQPLATSNPELARANDETVIAYLARFDRTNISMQVRSCIIEQLPGGNPNQEKIADALHLSLRSLQRRLKHEETSFKCLLEDTRRELAMQYIQDTHRPVHEIAYLLGFAEPSNFSRAFRRWAGCSPAEYRETEPSSAFAKAP